MPKTFTFGTTKVKLFTGAEVDASSKSPQSWVETPPAVMVEHEMDEPMFFYLTSPMAKAPWNNVATTKAPQFSSEFLAIYTDGKGPLTGAEVRSSEKAAGVDIDDSTAVRAYNNELAQDAAVFGGVLTVDEVAKMVSRTEASLFRRAVAWFEDVTGAVPVFFKTQTSKVISQEIAFTDEFGIPHFKITGVGKAETIGIAFPGPNALKRDVFNLTQFLGGKPNPLAAGKKAVDLPGRDRWFRVTGTEALSVFVYAPVLIWSAIQVSQLLEGRPVTMDQSPRVPEWLWEGR